MKAQTQTDIQFLPIIPIDDDTRAMLAYAASPEGRARIEQARRELQEGKGIIVTPGYFDEMKRRSSNAAMARGLSMHETHSLTFLQSRG
jgi:hypothetical protein